MRFCSIVGGFRSFFSLAFEGFLIPLREPNSNPLSLDPVGFACASPRRCWSCWSSQAMRLSSQSFRVYGLGFKGLGFTGLGFKGFGFKGLGFKV